jgi:beta-glucosidase
VRAAVDRFFERRVVELVCPDRPGDGDADAFGLIGGPFRSRFVSQAAARLLTLSTRWYKFGGDRRDLCLRTDDVALIRAVAAANPPTVVVVIGGGTMVLDPWDAEVAAVLMAWYPGTGGGRAIADILFGDAEPAGRLPVAIPKRQSDLPNVDWLARTVAYDRWLGQRKLDRDGVRAAYPFGFGLGYTTFELSDLTAGNVNGESIDVEVTVTNTGPRNGRHVVQIYGQLPAEPMHVLLGFRSVEVSAGDRVVVTVRCSTRPLQRCDGDRFVLAEDMITVTAASWAGDVNGRTAHTIMTTGSSGRSATVGHDHPRWPWR